MVYTASAELQLAVEAETPASRGAKFSIAHSGEEGAVLDNFPKNREISSNNWVAKFPLRNTIHTQVTQA